MLLINRRENGPKIDIQIKNVYGKEDTLITIQVDMFLAERFDMTYIDEKGEIRGAQQEKIPYMLIVGDKDVEANVVSVRRRGEGDLGQMPLSEFIDKILNDISTFRLD